MLIDFLIKNLLAIVVSSLIGIVILTWLKNALKRMFVPNAKVLKPRF